MKVRTLAVTGTSGDFSAASVSTPDDLASCHTAIVGEYVVEEQVPADLMVDLLADNAGILEGLGRRRDHGIEGQLEHELATHIVIGIMGDALRGEFRNGGDPLPYMPSTRVGISARWDNGRYAFSSEARHAFRQDRVPETETRAGAYTLVNLAFSANGKVGGRPHSITLRVDNLLDERYREATSRIKSFALNPGRNVTLLYRVII